MLINLLILLVVVLIIHLIIEYLSLPEPLNRVAYLILALAVIIYLLRLFGLA